MAASPVLFLLLTATSLIQASSTSRREITFHRRTQMGFRVSLMHVDSNRNFTPLQLVRRSINRSRSRLQRLGATAVSDAGVDHNIQAPVHAGEGEFLMNVSIGTPAIPFSAIMDTGSDLIWTKCVGPPAPIFDPAKSSTCSNISCSSELCSDANIFRCKNGCNYLYTYGDESSTEGFMASDTFTFLDSQSQNVTIPDIGFGCGVSNDGAGFSHIGGLVGLGRGQLSLVSQLNAHTFSYCLTSITKNRTSTLALGSGLNYSSDVNSGAIHRTPLLRSPFQPTFYYVSLEGISVGETLLPIAKSTFDLREDGSGGMIIDSGTTITYIQEEAFDLMKREFESQMKLRVSQSSDSTGLDLCFDLPTEDASEIAVPTLKFHFKGMDLDLPAENYMVADETMGLVCLAVAASGSVSIFGNLQQQNMLVVHDLGEETVSFVHTQCDQW